MRITLTEQEHINEGVNFIIRRKDPAVTVGGIVEIGGPGGSEELVRVIGVAHLRFDQIPNKWAIRLLEVFKRDGANYSALLIPMKKMYDGFKISELVTVLMINKLSHGGMNR